MPTRETPFEQVPVQEVMTYNPATADPDEPLSEAAGVLLQGGFRHLPVVDVRGRMVGMLSERDIRARLGTDVERFLEAAPEALSAPVSEAMTPDPLTVRMGTSLGEVLEIFADERVGALPVVDEADTLVGIVSYIDLLGWLQDTFKPPQPPAGDIRQA